LKIQKVEKEIKELNDPKYLEQHNSKKKKNKLTGQDVKKKLKSAKKRLKKLIASKDSKQELLTFRRQIKLTFEKPDRYYLSLPFNIKDKPMKEMPEEPRVIALDPGIRTFQTGYESRGHFHEFGKGNISRMYRTARRLDRVNIKILQDRKDQKE
jgi:transposase